MTTAVLSSNHEEERTSNQVKYVKYEITYFPLKIPMHRRKENSNLSFSNKDRLIFRYTLKRKDLSHKKQTRTYVMIFCVHAKLLQSVTEQI